MIQYNPFLHFMEENVESRDGEWVGRDHGGNKEQIRALNTGLGSLYSQVFFPPVGKATLYLLLSILKWQCCLSGHGYWLMFSPKEMIVLQILETPGHSTEIFLLKGEWKARKQWGNLKVSLDVLKKQASFSSQDNPDASKGSSGWGKCLTTGFLS